MAIPGRATCPAMPRWRAPATAASRRWPGKSPGLAPGTYVFEAMEYSAKDGSLVAQDSKSAVLK